MEHKIVMDPDEIPAEIEKLAGLLTSELHLAGLLTVTPYRWLVNGEESGVKEANFPFAPEYVYGVIDPTTGAAVGTIVEGHYQGLMPTVFSVYEIRPDLSSVASFDAHSRRN